MRLRSRHPATPRSLRGGLRPSLFGSLKTRLRWSYALVSVTPLLLLGIVLIVASFRAQITSIADEQQTTANWVAREVRASLSDIDEQLLRLGPLVGPNRPEADIQQAISTLTTSTPDIVDVVLMDGTGKERVHVSQLRGFFTSELIDRSLDPFVRWTLREGRVAQGTPTRQDAGIVTYPSYAPILTNDGQVIGAIRVEVRVDRINRALSEAPITNASTLYMVDNEAMIVLPADERFRTNAFPRLRDMVRGRGVTHEYANADGRAMIGAWSGVGVQPQNWWIVVEMPRAAAWSTVQQNVLWLLGAMAIVVLTTLGWGLYQSRRIIRPIEELNAGANKLGAGDLTVRIPVHNRDEIGALAVAFNGMAQHLEASQIEIERQNERLREGLALARDIQLGLLPSTLPGNVPHLAIQAHSVPAYEVGGDFYTYIALDEQRMAVAIGDISGKGVGAALMMALAASTVEAQGRNTAQPSHVLAALNKQLAARLTANNMNAALLYAIIDTEQCTVTVANAGMICPFLLRDGAVQMIEAYGLPLGAMLEARYSDTTAELQPGDLLLLVSDGIVEAHNPHGGLWGFDRLEATLRAHEPAARPDELIATIIEQVGGWMDGAEQHDDMTVVVIQPGLVHAPQLQTTLLDEVLVSITHADKGRGLHLESVDPHDALPTP